MNLKSLACVGFFLPCLAHAGTIIAATSATTDLGSFNAQYLPQYAIDQSGLTANYVSGVTDFDAFTTTTTTSSGGSSFNTWFSAQGILTGNFDFNLGGTFTIETFALWADPQLAGQGVKGFSLLASADSSFTTTTLLGSFSAVDGLGDAANLAQLFAFAPTSASYVRMQITSNNGSTLTTGMTEAAFEVSSPGQPPTSVPDSGATVALFSTALTGILIARRFFGK